MQVSWLSLWGCSPNGKLVQLMPESSALEGSIVPTTASSAPDGKTLSMCSMCGGLSVMDEALRSFNSALREFVSGGDNDRFGRCDGDDKRGFVGLLRSELDVDGTALAHSDMALE